MSLDETVPVDGHVHIYDCFPLAAFLDAAADNLLRSSAVERNPETLRGFLLLTETARDHAFRRLASGEARAASWSFAPAADGVSVTARREDGEGLVLVAGRQIRTGEGLEVLAIGVDGEFPDGIPTEDAVRRALGAGALPVIPWGFGKWWFRRGRIVDRLLRSELADRLCLADNGARPRGLREPGLLRAARKKDVPVLAGSDPLPFPWHTSRVGRYGFLIQGPADLQRPGRWIVDRLRQDRAQPRLFGRRSGALSFLRSQTAMQFRRLGAGRTP